MLGDDKKSLMKNMKRSERRHQAKCKFEKRLKIWINGIHCFFDDDYNRYDVSGRGAEIVKKNVREGKMWKFLRHTSTPCSCGGCAYLKYERIPKHKVIKQAFSEE